MSYQVEWVATAENELAQSWLDAINRAAVTRASHLIDLRLRDSPAVQGSPRPDGRRILFEPPLGILFGVFPDEQMVRVLQAWLIVDANGEG